MSTPAGLSAGSNPSWSLSIWNKVHRYRCLLTKYWWVLLLTLSVALCVTAYFQMNKPVTYASSAKLSVEKENRPVVAGDPNAAPAQDPDTLLNTQIQIMQTSSDVRRNVRRTCSWPNTPTCRPRPWRWISRRRNTNPDHRRHRDQRALHATLFAGDDSTATSPGANSSARACRTRASRTCARRSTASTKAASGQRGDHPVPARRQEGVRRKG